MLIGDFVRNTQPKSIFDAGDWEVFGVNGDEITLVKPTLGNPEYKVVDVNTIYKVDRSEAAKLYARLPYQEQGWVMEILQRMAEKNQSVDEVLNNSVHIKRLEPHVRNAIHTYIKMSEST